MTKCKTEGCKWGPKPRNHGDKQWKCGGGTVGCNRTAYCTQCGMGGRACAYAGDCFAILDSKLLKL